ncbi:hypothetical protein GGR56DRAFT_616305 [Xylariaceae sp. FL0804]|nr:hypothetical protein GGR56DRAFT_616305 [Xylariaceae sp. FL0804]
MTSPPTAHDTSDPGGRRHSTTEQHRPQFNSLLTADRLRESQQLRTGSMSKHIRKGRRSVFKEMGLSDTEEEVQREADSITPDNDEFGETTEPASEPMSTTMSPTDREDSTRSKGKFGWLKHPRARTAASAPPPVFAGLHRLSMIALLIAVVLPAISYNNGRQKVEVSGADAGVIRRDRSVVLEDRADSPTDVCLRWGAQCAIINGTVYYYGGRSKTSGDQVDNQWNNDFLTLDLTKTWDISSPSLTGLPQPSGPPAVSLGYLWNDLDQLFLYGGEFSDPNPTVLPSAVSTWQYDILSSTWTEFPDPLTSAGNFSTAAGIPVQRAAEGAGISVPELGVSWYFGGHLNWATTQGWSYTTDTVYLKSLLEFTHPGYANSAVDDLHASGAPDGGAYRNITSGGIQDQDGFSERADGVLVYVPGWGPRGVLLGLGGGVVNDDDTQAGYASMSTIDVYDIETSEWYHQQTSGDAPQVRVNPCAVIFTAPDASSFNIYMYGGQTLLPYGTQTQYSDVWILTIPSFTWIKVDTSGDDPPARAGHQCAPRDGQMVVVGGYISPNTSCESTGIFNFDASSLEWKSSFDAADHAADLDADNSVLAGSYGYQVPGVVQSVVGGSSDGGATATTPASGPATGGPFLTGTPPVFTVTATVSGSGSTSTVSGIGSGSGSSGTHKSSRSDAGTIVAGVVAGIAGLAACYLGFCAWLWRRQVRAYRRHMAVANRYSNYPDQGSGSGGDGGGGGRGPSSSSNEKFPPTHAPGGGLLGTTTTTITGGPGGGSGSGNGSGGGAAAGLLGAAVGAVGAATRRASSREHSRNSERERLRKQNNNNNNSNMRGGSSGGATASAAHAADDPEQFAWVGQLGDPPPRWMAANGGGSNGADSSNDPSPGSGTVGTGTSGSLRPRPSEDRNPFSYYALYDDYVTNGGGAGGGGVGRSKSGATRSTASGGSAEALLDGREPNFFSVVLGPRRALRVVNGMED